MPTTISGDVTRLRQILVNLLANAVKFTHQGEVEVRVHAEPAAEQTYTLHFSVRDTGIGIPQDRMDRLFQSFSQVDASMTRKYGGTGLGLAISEQLCTLMGGTMWVESEEGVGSTFHFTVTATAAVQQTLAAPDPASSTPIEPHPDGQQPMRILLAENNVVNQMVALRFLERLGYRADVAANGIEVIEAVRQVQYDVILMDMQMPEMDGIEATRHLVTDTSARPRPYIIALTANAMQSDRERCLEAGMDDYLSKPVRSPELRAALDRAAAGRTSRPAPFRRRDAASPLS